MDKQERFNQSESEDELIDLNFYITNSQMRDYWEIVASDKRMVLHIKELNDEQILIIWTEKDLLKNIKYSEFEKFIEKTIIEAENINQILKERYYMKLFAIPER